MKKILLLFMFNLFAFQFFAQDLCEDFVCPNNVISNSGITENTSGTGDLGTQATSDFWTSGALSPQIIEAGHCDPYSFQSWGDSSVKESYCQSGVNIQQGHTYSVSFCAKFAPINANPAVTSVNVRISADNACPTFNDYNPTTASIIGVETNISDQNWAIYTLPDWIAPADLNTLIVNAENFLTTNSQATTISWAHVDNICITEVEPISCGGFVCPNNVINNFGITENTSGTGDLGTQATSDFWTSGALSPQIIADGHCDPYSFQSWGDSSVKESYCQSGVNIQQGHTYRVSFCAKFAPINTNTAVTSVNVRISADNACPTFNDYNPTTASIIGVETNISDQNWAIYILPDWIAPADLNTLIVNAENFLPTNSQATTVSWAHVDNICITEIEPIPCEDFVCPNNVIINSGITQNTSGTGDLGTQATSDSWTSGALSPQIIEAGHCDPYSFQSWGDSSVKESYCQSGVNIQQGHTYSVSFCAKFAPINANPAVTSVNVRISADNACPTFNDYNPTTASIIGVEPYIGDLSWAVYTLPVWTAPADFNTLIVNAENFLPTNSQATTVSWAHVDNICITEIEPIPCEDFVCPNNVIINSGITENTSGTGDLGTQATSDSWTSGALSPQIIEAGHCDPYSFQSWGDSSVKESYCQSGVNIQQGHTYSVSFCAKFAPINANPAVTSVNVRISADNACPTFNDYNPITASIIGVEPYIGDLSWAVYTLPVWTAPADFNTLIVNAENFLTTNSQATTISWAHVDNICITEVEPIPCEDFVCPNNVINNSGITENTSGTGDLGTQATSDFWTSGALSPQIIEAGHCDPYSFQSWGDSSVKESYCQSGVNIQQGHTYSVSFCAKFAPINANPAVTSVNVRISADNACPTFNDYNPTTASIIGVVTNIAYQNWAIYTLPAWTAPADLNTLIVNAENFLTTNSQATTISWAHVDNICITEVEPIDTTCCMDENYFFQQVIPATQIINNSLNVEVRNILLDNCHQVTIDWDDGVVTGPLLGNQLPQIHQYSNDGIYTVCVKIEEFSDDGKQCWFEQFCDTIPIMHIGTDDMNNQLEGIKFYPNPTTDLVYIEAPEIITLSDLKLYDMSGKLVKQVDVDTNTATLSIAQFPDGIYFIKVTGADGRFTSSRILKQR